MGFDASSYIPSGNLFHSCAIYGWNHSLKARVVETVLSEHR